MSGSNVCVLYASMLSESLTDVPLNEMHGSSIVLLRHLKMLHRIDIRKMFSPIFSTKEGTRNTSWKPFDLNS